MPKDSQIGWVTFYYMGSTASAYARCFECGKDYLSGVGGTKIRPLYLSVVKNKYNVRCSSCPTSIYVSGEKPFLFLCEYIRDEEGIELIRSLYEE